MGWEQQLMVAPNVVQGGFYGSSEEESPGEEESWRQEKEVVG